MGNLNWTVNVLLYTLFVRKLYFPLFASDSLLLYLKI